MRSIACIRGHILCHYSSKDWTSVAMKTSLPTSYILLKKHHPIMAYMSYCEIIIDAV